MAASRAAVSALWAVRAGPPEPPHIRDQRVLLRITSSRPVAVGDDAAENENGKGGHGFHKRVADFEVHGDGAGHKEGDDDGCREHDRGVEQTGEECEGRGDFQESHEIAGPGGQTVGGEFFEHVRRGAAAVGSGFVEAQQPHVEQAATDDDLADLDKGFHWMRGTGCCFGA